jgi:hypothetical protein
VEMLEAVGELACRWSTPTIGRTALAAGVRAREPVLARHRARVCVEDVAYRVVTGNLAPDHSTIAEPPEHLRTREGRRKALREAKESLQRERADADDDDAVAVELDPPVRHAPPGRRAWPREGRRELEARRQPEDRPIARDRADRLCEACRRPEQELDVDHASNTAYEAWRERGRPTDRVAWRPG